MSHIAHYDPQQNIDMALTKLKYIGICLLLRSEGDRVVDTTKELKKYLLEIENIFSWSIFCNWKIGEKVCPEKLLEKLAFPNVTKTYFLKCLHRLFLLWPILPSPLLAGRPHSTMSCDCQLVACVHCPQCNVICHCAVVALQTKSVQMAQEASQHHYHHQSQPQPTGFFKGEALLDFRAAVTLTGWGAGRHPDRLSRAPESSQTLFWGKLIWIILGVYTHAYDIRIRAWTTACVCVSQRESAKTDTETARAALRDGVTLCQKAAALFHTVSFSNTKAYAGKNIFLFWLFTLCPYFFWVHGCTHTFFYLIRLQMMWNKK